jgi:hypothetical protein
MTRTTWSLVLGTLLVACDRSTPPAPTTTSSARPQAIASTAPSASKAVPSASETDASFAAPDSGTSTGAITFDAEKVGDPPRDFEPVVGEWHIAEVNGAKGLKVDGGKWRSGEPSVTLADQAKHLYGERYAEFLDGVKAFAFFPFAIAKAEPPKGDLRISVRFYPEAGKIDQAAGIIFAIAPNGTYWGVRANALEDNILFFKVVNGKRTVFDNVRNVPTPSKTWHTLVVELRGKQLVASLDGTKRFEKTLDFVPTGRVGLWSKADSQVLFDDFTVSPLGAP